MKKKRVFILLLSMISLGILGSSCARKKPRSQEGITVSNMADETAKNEVRKNLELSIRPDNVEHFIKELSDYNETIEKTSLKEGFNSPENLVYDLKTMGDLWLAKKGDFPGTNCRINAFMLLKDEIETGEGEYDASLLFIDHDAILSGKIFNQEDLEKFDRLFSKVKTEKTKDARIHAKRMEEYLSEIKFSEKARLVSVVLHDDLDEDCLFIGHTGVLVETEEGYLFVEKLSFEEPYQALKFTEKEELYSYLLEKYGKYYGDTTAKPFIMENNKTVKFSD